jgi:hypothetical protein
MINYSELRVGNWIKEIDGGFDRVTLDFFHALDVNTFGVEDYDPILLTPEILEAAGFTYGPTEERGTDEDQKVWGIQISNSDYLEFETVHGIEGGTGNSTQWNEWRLVSGFSMRRTEFWNQPKYLHQLQNLYHALTGEELQIDLTEKVNV